MEDTTNNVLAKSSNETSNYLIFRILGEVDRTEIEQETRDQAQNNIWRRERLCRLTASNFGRICKMRAHTSCKSSLFNFIRKFYLQVRTYLSMN